MSSYSNLTAHHYEDNKNSFGPGSFLDLIYLFIFENVDLCYVVQWVYVASLHFKNNYHFKKDSGWEECAPIIHKI